MLAFAPVFSNWVIFFIMVANSKIILQLKKLVLKHENWFYIFKIGLLDFMKFSKCLLTMFTLARANVL